MNKCEADELEEQDKELLKVHAAPLKADSLIHKKSAFTLEDKKTFHPKAAPSHSNADAQHDNNAYDGYYSSIST